MKKITIIGTGNVAYHLCIAFAGIAEELINVSSRTLEDLPVDSDLYLICVSDDAIKEVASRLPRLSGIVAHTSGSVPADILSSFAADYGSFYPLQTFTKGVDLNYSEIPVFIEGRSREVTTKLREAAGLITTHVHEADSEKRRKIHVASVLACNYANYLWTSADRLLSAEGFSIDILKPLIKASVDKIMRISPEDAQTGPAARGDKEVMRKHLQLLANTREQEIYRLLGNAILEERGFGSIS